MCKFEVYTDQGGHARWRLRADDGTVLATSSYSFMTGSDAWSAAREFQQGSTGCDFEVFTGAAGSYRWRALDASGRPVASSRSWFSSPDEARSGVRAVLTQAVSAGLG